MKENAYCPVIEGTAEIYIGRKATIYMTSVLALRRSLVGLAIASLFASLIAFAPLFASAHNESVSSASANKAEVVLTDSGKALVRGAKVTAVSSSTITAQTVLGSATVTWTILTDSATSFYDARGKTGGLAGIAVGDTVSFAGAIEGGNMTNVRATVVKDWSPVMSEKTLKGTLSSLNTGNLTFVLSTKSHKDSSKNVTVQLSSTTAITLNGTTSALANLAVNDGIKVTGTLSSDGMTLAALKVEATRPAPKEDKDFSRLIKRWFSDKHFLNFNWR